MDYHIIKIAINYIEMIVCIKIACFQSCSHSLSRLNSCCEIQLCHDEYLVKQM